MREILRTFCFPKQFLVVPFLGSGVTLRAGYMNQNIGYGWDMDELCKRRFINKVYTDMKDVENDDSV